jgi:peptidoglycan glycosyltransferase
MKPDLVQQVTASDLSTVQGMSPSVLRHSITSSVSDSMKQMMLAVVQQPEGTAYAFRQAVTGVEIAGKTGTAETGQVSLNDAAFTCFAPFANPDIAVGVIIQGGGYGASAAAPIAVQVIKAYQQAMGNQ